MAKSTLPGHVPHHLPSLCPSSSANAEDIQSLSDQGGKYSAGIVHTISSHSSIIPFSMFDENQSTKVDSKSELGEEEAEGLEKRRWTGNDPKIFASSVSMEAEWPPWRSLASSPITPLQPHDIFTPAGPESSFAHKVCRVLTRVWCRDKGEAREIALGLWSCSWEETWPGPLRPLSATPLTIA